jgi:hypothetical protein
LEYQYQPWIVRNLGDCDSRLLLDQTQFAEPDAAETQAKSDINADENADENLLRTPPCRPAVVQYVQRPLSIAESQTGTVLVTLVPYSLSPARARNVLPKVDTHGSDIPTRDWTKFCRKYVSTTRTSESMSMDPYLNTVASITPGNSISKDNGYTISSTTTEVGHIGCKSHECADCGETFELCRYCKLPGREIWQSELWRVRSSMAVMIAANTGQEIGW